jgi:hypothetical protein
MAPPTYQEYDVSQIVNIKSLSVLPVFGDGHTVTQAFPSSEEIALSN